MDRDRARASDMHRDAAVVIVLAAIASGASGASHDAGVPTRHDWQLVDGKHWTIVSEGVEDMAVTDALERTNGPCRMGMVEVAGRMKLDGPAGSVEMLQDRTCTKWIRREFPARCGAFDRAMWLDASPALPTKEMRFCIDRFEYPNRKGAYPLIFVTWREAGTLCTRQAKRLCTEDEWTFSCESEESVPYPYGYTRDEEACVIDRPHRPFDDRRFSPRDGSAIESELDRLWQGERSGARPGCRSPFGVYDLTGNVDEWTASTQVGGYRSILKGGYWGRIRARCRPSTRAHGEDFAFYQQGFRCCADR
jgi:hypothetical protein